jgi:hypothetical protein
MEPLAFGPGFRCCRIWRPDRGHLGRSDAGFAFRYFGTLFDCSPRRRLNGCDVLPLRPSRGRGSLAALRPRWPFLGNGIDILVFLEEIGNIQERVSLEPEIDKRRLHSGQNARYSSLVNAPGKGVFVRPLEVNLDQLVVF